MDSVFESISCPNVIMSNDWRTQFLSQQIDMEEENSDLMTEFVGHGIFQHKSIVIGAIKNVTWRLDAFC